MFNIIGIIIQVFSPTVTMPAAPQLKFPATTMTQAHARGCSPHHWLRFAFYLICLTLLELLFHHFPDARSPSAQISRYWNDPDTRARLLAPALTTFILFYLICLIFIRIIISVFSPTVMMPAAPQPIFPAIAMTQARARGCSPQH